MSVVSGGSVSQELRNQPGKAQAFNPALGRQRQVVIWIPGQPRLQIKFQGQSWLELGLHTHTETLSFFFF